MEVGGGTGRAFSLGFPLPPEQTIVPEKVQRRTVLPAARSRRTADRDYGTVQTSSAIP